MSDLQHFSDAVREAAAEKAKLRELTNDELVRHVAKAYDDGAPYFFAWGELVKRVGQEEAERLVDQA